MVSWVGDCRAYGWTGEGLQLYTTDHTVGQQLRMNGAPWELAVEHGNWVRTTLSRVVVATVYEVEIPPGELVLLTSDGVHDQIAHDVLVALVGQHQGCPQGLADAIVAVALDDSGGYRDDATAVVLSFSAGTAGRTQPSWWCAGSATPPGESSAGRCSDASGEAAHCGGVIVAA